MKKPLTIFALTIVFCSAARAQQNLALDSQAQASASSTIPPASGSYPASAAIDGDRKGYSWGSGGGWNDGTRGVFPDWHMVELPRTYSLGRVVVTTLQDSFSSPTEPTATQTCMLYGVKDFDVEVRTPSGWVVVATITNNTLCKREVTFNAVRGDAWRVVVNSSWDGLYSRIVESSGYPSSSTQ